MKIVGFLLMICITNSWAQDLLPMMPGIVLPDITTPKSPLPLGDKEVIPPNTEKPDEEERLIRCKRPLCDMMCAYGFAVGEDGCPICKCKTPEDLCHEHGDCPEGTRCQVPTCFGDLCASVKPECIPECPLLDCSPCPGGVYHKDERGCQTCECEDMLCPVPMCSEPCPNGYANDEHGCMTCKCNTEPQSQKKQATSEEKHVEVDSDEKSSSEEEELEVSHCPLAMCRMYCRYGFEKDEHGCEMCKCRRQPEHCPQFMCLMYCEAGFDKDENGCDICQCRQQPIACPRRMCRMMMNCPNGFEKDERGCDMCMCKPASKHDICDGVTCPVGQSCKPVQPTDCVAGMCDPLPVCCPPSVCELHQGHIMPEDQIEMMMHHLAMPERENFFAGPARCKPDGHFEPKQCLQEQCFCVDDRSVMQLTSLMMDDPDCRDNITKEMRLSFQLEHDLDDNNLDGALQDIEGLVKATLGDWMAVSRDSVVLVQVAYSKPGMLFVQATVIHDGLSDLTSASHYMHRLMHDGHCNLNYKNHVLKPKPDTIHFEHHYETTPEILAYNDMCTGPMCFSNLMFPFCGIGIALFSVILFTTLYIIVKRRRLINNQFRHRRMEDNFRKNLVLSCELEKPELLAGDDVKVTLSDATEDKSVA